MQPSSGDGPGQADVFINPSSNATLLSAQVTYLGDVYRVEATGLFNYSPLKINMADVTGVFTSIAMYKNNTAWESYTSTVPLDLNKFLFTDPNYGLTILSGDDIFIGSSTVAAKDYIRGEAGNDTFTGYGDSGSSGGDYFFGGTGVDTAIFRGKQAEYNINASTTIWDAIKDDGSRLWGFVVSDKTTNRDGYDNLVGVERLRFSDFTIGLDVAKGEISGSAYRLYKAALNRTPDADGLAGWINALTNGMSMTTVANGFLQSQEFKSNYGGENPTNDNLVWLLYQNVLHRGPDQTGYLGWVNALNKGEWTKEAVLIGFSESAENIQQTAPLIANGVVYHEFWL